jgi:hypothetical protein
MPSQWKDNRRPPGVLPEYLLVCGTRTFDDYDLLEWKLEKLTYFWDDVVVVHGGNVTKLRDGSKAGADYLAERWAEHHWYDRVHFLPDWEKHGAAAGPIRNREMCEFVAGHGGLLVAFWDGKSKGTADCVRQFRKLCPSRVVVQHY